MAHKQSYESRHASAAESTWASRIRPPPCAPRRAASPTEWSRKVVGFDDLEGLTQLMAGEPPVHDVFTPGRTTKGRG